MQDRNEAFDKDRLEGVVQGISDGFVWIDLGTDHLAVGSASEFAQIDRNQKVQVYVVGSDPEDLYLVSKNKRTQRKNLDDLREAWHRKAVITGHVAAHVKGGFVVDIGSPAFMPTSKSGGRDREEREELVGREVLCTIEEFLEKGNDIIVNRRALLESAEVWGKRSALEELKVGSRVRGRVCTLTDFGAFIDLGGIDGLVHVRDISWRYVQKPSDVLSLGQEVEALVDRVDARNGRVGLSLKALQTDPWLQVSSKYHVGDRVQGKVTGVTSVGAFVELEPGVEGLVHSADLLWSGTEPISRGFTSDFYVVDVNAPDRKIALAVEKDIDDPWQDVDQRFPVGTIVSGKITTLTSFGAFVALDRRLEGLIHVKDIREGRVSHPSDVLTEGQHVRAQVLECDPTRNKLRLGLKQVLGMESVRPAESQASVAEEENVTTADYTHYSRNVFVNCPTGKPYRGITEAIVFAVLEASFIPRLAVDGATLVAAVRECQYGVHDISRTFEMGLFFGCQQYGADLHRLKAALLVNSDTHSDVFGQHVYSHSNRPADALHEVVKWLAKIRNKRVNPEQVWSRYRQFRRATTGNDDAQTDSFHDAPFTVYIQAVSKWLAQ